jgi:hypothetical protein
VHPLGHDAALFAGIALEQSEIEIAAFEVVV